MGVCFFFVCAPHKTEPTCAITEVYFFSHLFAQGVRIPPLAVSCVIRRVGRRIADSRTCLPLAFCFVPVDLFDLSLLIICSHGNIPLLRYAPESIKRIGMFVLHGVRFLFFGDPYAHRPQCTYPPRLYFPLSKNVYPTPLTTPRLCVMGSQHCSAASVSEAL